MAKTESLFPILQPSTTAGLARTAAEAPLDSSGCLTEYRPLTSRSILNKVTSNRGLPFSHAINPYRGCEFGCRYCYARYTHEFLELGPEEFERKIYFKQNAAWLLEQELRRLRSRWVRRPILTSRSRRSSRSRSRCSRYLRGRADSGWGS